MSHKDLLKEHRYVGHEAEYCNGVFRSHCYSTNAEKIAQAEASLLWPKDIYKRYYFWPSIEQRARKLIWC